MNKATIKNAIGQAATVLGTAGTALLGNKVTDAANATGIGLGTLAVNQTPKMFGGKRSAIDIVRGKNSTPSNPKLVSESEEQPNGNNNKKTVNEPHSNSLNSDTNSVPKNAETRKFVSDAKLSKVADNGALRDFVKNNKVSTAEKGLPGKAVNYLLERGDKDSLFGKTTDNVSYSPSKKSGDISTSTQDSSTDSGKDYKTNDKVQHGNSLNSDTNSVPKDGETSKFASDTKLNKVADIGKGLG